MNNVSSSPVVHHETSFELGDLFIFIWQKKFRILLLALSIIVYAGFFVMQLPKVYIAHSTLLLSDSSGIQLPSMSILGKSSNNSKMDTYIEFIRSRQFIKIIVAKLELTKEKEFIEKKPKDTLAIDYATDHLLSNLTLKKIRNTDMLRVSVSSYQSKLAMKIVNAIGPYFFDFHAKQQQVKVKEKSTNLNTQLTDISQRLVTAEKKLHDYQDKYNIVDVHIQIEMAKNEIASLIKEKQLNEKLISEEQASIAQIKENVNNEKVLLQIPWVMNSKLIQNIQNQIVVQSKILAEVSKRYKYKHPRYIAAKSTLASLKQDLTTTIQHLISGLQQNIKRYILRNKQLKAQLINVKNSLNNLGKQEYQLAKLTREVKSMQKISEMFSSKLRETEILQDMGKTKDFTVVDTATEPKFPSKPNVILIMLMVSVISFLFSIAFWLIIHFKKDKESKYRHVLRAMGVPVLISLPRVKKNFRHKNALPLRSAKGETSYAFSEAIRSLRTSILIGQEQHKNRVVAITSANPGEGKASLVINLAEACSNMEKTLLADIDLSRPSIARAFELPEHSPGITDYFDQKVKFSECLHYENIKRLTVLPSGSVPSDPLAMISTQHFVDFLKKLTTIYERLILEAPPIKTISDALVVSRLVDAVIIICDTEITDILTLTKTIQRLKDADIQLLGVVFNRSKS